MPKVKRKRIGLFGPKCFVFADGLALVREVSAIRWEPREGVFYVFAAGGTVTTFLPFKGQA